jgi:hypothetical protein
MSTGVGKTIEVTWKSGEWDHLSLPFAQIIERWKAELASPLHFASVGQTLDGSL